MHRSVWAAGNYYGAMMSGGRWNPIGTPMLYAAEHLSLTCLEILVHADKNQLPRDYVWSCADLDQTPPMLLAANLTSVAACQMAGQVWVHTANQLAVRVSSVVIPEEFNILLNPMHDGYASLAWMEPRPFRFDRRLFIAEPQPL